MAQVGACGAPPGATGWDEAADQSAGPGAAGGRKPARTGARRLGCGRHL